MMLRKLLVIVALILFVFAFSGCESEGPAEKAGENIDEAIEKAGEKSEQAVEAVKDTAEDVKDKAEDTADKLK